MRNRFHSLSTLSVEDARSGRTRPFAGDGTPFLRVPGLVTLESVRIGQQEIPLAEKRKYPTDGTHQHFEDVVEPLIQLERDSEGPVLLRSILSNNGLWQSGQTVYVTGEWEDAPAETPQSEPVVFQPGDRVTIAQGAAKVEAVVEAVLEDGTVKIDKRAQPVTADKLTFVSRPA